MAERTKVEEKFMFTVEGTKNERIIRNKIYEKVFFYNFFSVKRKQ